MYNLRRSATYRRRRTVVAKTQATHSTIGQRRKPQPGGQPGYVRVDTVHQGDHDGAMGVYYINAVDEMTQFQFVGSVQAISERFLLPMLEGLIKAFPFVIQGIHADNGSEYINHRVAALLNKLRIGEFTKSRPRHCNDNPFNIPLPFTHFPTPPTAPSTSLPSGSPSYWKRLPIANSAAAVKPAPSVLK